MITVLLKNWKLGLFTVLVLLVAFFAYQWKSAKAEIAEQAVVLNQKISTLEETLAHNRDQLKKAEEAVVLNQKISTLEETLAHNRDQLKKAEEANKEYERNAEAQRVIDKANTEAKDSLGAKTKKVDRTANKLQQKSHSKIQEERTLSAESAAILTELIETVDPLLTESQRNVS